MIGKGRKSGGFYVLDGLNIFFIGTPNVALSSFHSSDLFSDVYPWHARFSHVSYTHFQFLVSAGTLGQLKTRDISDCSGCAN